ncbi:DUF58 domain-containing protein [Silvimonas soli]|uniref:DUF58 domain-containing protein n=1 Tax=Silvimonas soli TaxID=2980100 RepID=UPI0024B36863|nr:DUF58 domain-containing protein [Silvimonas soli]
MLKLLRPLQQRGQRWMNQRHPAVSGTLQLRQNRIYVLPSGFGLAYAATCVLVLIGAINYQLSLAYLFAFLMLGLGHSGLIQAFRNLLGLTLNAQPAPAVFAGDMAHFPVRLGDARKFGRRNLQLRAVGGVPQQVINIAASTDIMVWLAVPAVQRGWLPLPRITIETRFPTGWCRAWSHASLKANCLVYPRPENNPPPWPDASGNEYAGRRQRTGDDDFAGLRQYQPGDAMRQVAWKQSARLDWLAVRLHDTPRSSMQHLRWDDAAGLNVEARLSRLTAWVLKADAAGLPYTLMLPDQVIATAAGASQREQCLHALALFGLAQSQGSP